jgi:hypothetical protein
MDASGGVLFFSTANTGVGNNNNTIDNNNITNSADANREFMDITVVEKKLQNKQSRNILENNQKKFWGIIYNYSKQNL